MVTQPSPHQDHLSTKANKSNMSTTRISEEDARCHFQDHKASHVVVAESSVGVPTDASLSRFLSLIRVRLPTDPEHADLFS
ncbi:hypothetical protein EYF80_019958 [Liparis tanakae]|uniref:Uncharacterized protein n=1 Tax=Liparis tanakae TaxID=230148 RepID=A0A4Z2HWC2_9TELE|nr:hypothetical protein EYF80_019958 [Liparis tanakae]